MLTEDGAGALSWVDIPDLSGVRGNKTRTQVPSMKKFEGVFYRNGTCYFTTKKDNRVWAYGAVNNTIAVAYDDNLTRNPPLTGTGNITGDNHVGDLYIAEDGGNMEVCIITPDDIVAPFFRVTGRSSSELAGVAFSAAGDHMYFSSQRGTSGTSDGGIAYEVIGPFRNAL